MSATSSRCYSIEPPEFKADPKMVSMLVNILTARHGILHFHGQTGELTTFQWPSTEYGHKIHPSQFADYRETHAFRYPCCMCASGGSTCGYMLNIEKFFGRACVPTAYYPRRFDQPFNVVPPFD
ncbi:hypothetical protein C8R48DRAFT_678365 [Suillus tomentosus]|nr:hypothetical protein C8R48DRAFT_678365 [Suillus tomentosus]